MSELANNLVSLQWWIGVVVVGVLVNLVSAYLKPNLDLALGRLISTRAQRNKEQAEARQKRIASLRGDIQTQQFAATEALHNTLMGVLFVVYAGIFLAFASTMQEAGSPEWAIRIIFLVGAISAAASLNALVASASKRREIYESRDLSGAAPK